MRVFSRVEQLRPTRGEARGVTIGLSVSIERYEGVTSSIKHGDLPEACLFQGGTRVVHMEFYSAQKRKVFIRGGGYGQSQWLNLHTFRTLVCI